MSGVFFSIITLTNESEDTVSDTLKSLAEQSTEDWQSVVQDCQSCDTTISQVQGMGLRNQVIKSVPDEGIYDGLNKALAECEGSVIGVLHCGDRYFDEDVLLNVQEVFENTEADVVYGGVEYFAPGDDKTVRRWRPDDFAPAALRTGWMCPHTATFIKKSVFEKCGLYNKSFTVAGDYEFLLRILQMDDIVVEKFDGIVMRMATGGVSTINSFEMLTKVFREDLRAVRSNDVGGFLTVCAKKIRKLLKLK